MDHILLPLLSLFIWELSLLFILELHLTGKSVYECWVVGLGVTKIKSADKIMPIFSLFQMPLILPFTAFIILPVK